MSVASPQSKENAPETEAGTRLDSGVGPSRRLDQLLRPLRFIAGVVLFGLVILATVRSWDEVRPAFARLSLTSLVAAGSLVLLGLMASAMTWRVALAEFGATVRPALAARIYLLGQLGKYAPGSVWALAVQMGLAARAGVPGGAALAASIIAIGANLATGLALGAFLVPTVIGGGIWRVVMMVVLLAAFAIALSPPVLTRVISVVQRFIRGWEPLGGMTPRGTLKAIGWSLGSWVCYGMCLWVLAIGVDAPVASSLPLCLAGAALAMTLGFLVLVAPSGIGVREVVIVGALSPVLERPEALAVALAARLVFTVGDLVAAVGVLGLRTGSRASLGEPAARTISLRVGDVEALNDALARAYPIDDYYTTAPPPIRWVEGRRLAIVRLLVGDTRGLDVAEVGSGGGHVLRMFPEGRLTAIDVSGVYLDIARKNLAGYDVRFLKGEVDKMKLPKASFDRVICTEVLEHVVDPERVLDAISGLLRPSGAAVITVPNDALIERVKKVVRWIPLGWFSSDRLEWGGDSYHLHRWRPDEFEQLLARYLSVADRRAIPFRFLPLRTCFRCVPKRDGAAPA